jgi:hypothetical protein
LLQEENNQYFGANNVPSYNTLRFAPEKDCDQHLNEEDIQKKRYKEAEDILGDLEISPPKF